MDRPQAYDELRRIARKVQFNDEAIDMMEVLLVVDNVTEVVERIEVVIDDLVVKGELSGVEAEQFRRRLGAVLNDFGNFH